MIKEGEGSSSFDAPPDGRESKERWDELFKENSGLFDGDKPREINGLGAFTADWERTELEKERPHMDPNSKDIPLGLQGSLVPKQPGAAASSTKPA
jgi:hypothetical protein